MSISIESKSPVERIVRWRKDNAEEYRRRRIAGIRNSEKALNAIRKMGNQCRKKALETKSKMPQFQATEQHIRALVWNLRDCNGKTYQFKNLAKFVREHEEFFEEDDVRWEKRGNGINCRAYSGLSSLHPERTVPQGSWKGWTWVSIHERRFNDGEDLLNRKAVVTLA